MTSLNFIAKKKLQIGAFKTQGNKIEDLKIRIFLNLFKKASHFLLIYVKIIIDLR